MRKIIPLGVATLVLAALAGVYSAGQSVPVAGGGIASAPAFTEAAERPIATTHPAIAQHTVIISIDGCRPDVLLMANTPVIHALLPQASFTFYAETTDIAITLPSHTSMLTGYKPEQHGIDFNSDPPDDQIIYPKVPTVLEIAHAHGMTTGVFSTKAKFRIYTRPGVIDYSYISKESSSADDLGVAMEAAQAIIAHKPDVMLVHFGNNDRTGHKSGWDSPEQRRALEGADKSVGIVLEALRQAGIYRQTLVIITADHGGSGTSHGKDDPRSRYIPWIAIGPRVRKNFDLTSDRTLTVHTEDTFATVCYFMELPMAPDIFGRPVTLMVTGRELMHAK